MTQPTETPIVTVSVLVPADRVAAARAESQAYYKSRGRELPLDSFLTDTVTDAQGQVTHYSCELLLSPDDASHIMRYYRQQFRPGHVPAQVLTREPLDVALERIGGTCEKHNTRKNNRNMAKRRHDKKSSELVQSAREKRNAKLREIRKEKIDKKRSRKKVIRD